MGRKSLKEKRQLEIIKVFYKVAKKEGLENTSIAKIAKVMDVNPSLIIHYFDSKEELTYALIDFLLDKYLTIYKAEAKNSTQLHRKITTLIEDIFSKKWNKLFDDGLFYSCYALTFREKKVKAMYSDITEALRNHLAQLIHACNDTGALKIEKPRDVADLIFALVDGAYFYLSVSTPQKDFDSRINLYKAEAYRLLGLDFPAVIPSS